MLHLIGAVCRWFTAVVGIGIAAGAMAHEVKQGDLAIAHPFVSVGKACGLEVTRAYVMLVVNTGKQPDRLLGAELDHIGKAKILQVRTDAGKSIRSLVKDGLEVAPGKNIAVVPPHYVLEFAKSGQPLVEGGVLRGALMFQRTGRVPVTFMVEAAHLTADGKSDCSEASAPRR